MKKILKIEKKQNEKIWETEKINKKNLKLKVLKKKILIKIE